MAKVKTPAIYEREVWSEKLGERVNEEIEITVGMPCTFNVGSDLYPAFVSRISDSGKTVWIKRANYIADKENGHDYFSNQVYIITPNDDVSEERATKRKNGRWHLNEYSRVGFGHAKHYEDPHF